MGITARVCPAARACEQRRGWVQANADTEPRERALYREGGRYGKDTLASQEYVFYSGVLGALLGVPNALKDLCE